MKGIRTLSYDKMEDIISLRQISRINRLVAFCLY